jgi:hypothetical protein
LQCSHRGLGAVQGSWHNGTRHLWVRLGWTDVYRPVSQNFSVKISILQVLTPAWSQLRVLTHNSQQPNLVTTSSNNVFISFIFLNPKNYGKTISFLKVSVFNARSTALVWLNLVPGGCAEPSGHYGWFPGQSGNFGGSHGMITQNFKNSKKSVFFHTLDDVKSIESSLEPTSLWVYHVPRHLRKTASSKLILSIP